jgi:hypothetical protein
VVTCVLGRMVEHGKPLGLTERRTCQSFPEMNARVSTSSTYSPEYNERFAWAIPYVEWL